MMSNVVSDTELWISLFSYSGKFMVTATFQIIHIITGELFPTSLRSVMLNEATVCGRFGSILAPFINTFLVRCVDSGFILALACILFAATFSSFAYIFDCNWKIIFKMLIICFWLFEFKSLKVWDTVSPLSTQILEPIKCNQYSV